MINGSGVAAIANGVINNDDVMAVAEADTVRSNDVPKTKRRKAKQSKTSTDEESFLNDNAALIKTPVSVLQELLSRRAITPSYEILQIEGAIHEPTYRYRVSFKDANTMYSATGVGRSKKIAKHASARALIDKLCGVPATVESVNDRPQNTGVIDANANTIEKSEPEEKIVGNPIGWLQELCIQRCWPPVTYVIEIEEGNPHERNYFIACKLLNFREIGKGKSKKIAKRVAAHKMWKRLQENPLDGPKAESMCTSFFSEMRDCSYYYNDLKGITVPTLTTQHSTKVSQFHKTLKNTDGKKLLRLQNTCFQSHVVDFIMILNEIAEENRFEVTYVDIEEKTFSDQFQCLVQLSTLPVGVCHGVGATIADAKRAAAQNALEYLKIMTKK